MYVPTPTTTLRDFTIEHVRCIVPPHRAHTTALALVSGMLPPLPAPETKPDPLNAALRWFGERLFAVPFPETCLSSSRVERTHSARRCVERLVGTDTACVLDLAVVTHTTAVTQRKGRRDTAVCGSATLSVADSDAAIRMALRHMDYGHGHDQLRVPFAATAATPARGTLDDLRRAVELSGTINPDHDVPTLSVLSAGRSGDRSDRDYATCMRFAHFAPDGHDVWKVRPAAVGTDIDRDAHIAELSDRAHYRVFEAWPADPFEWV